MITLQKLQARFLPLLAPEDFFLLVAYATGKEKVFLLAHPEYVLSDDELEKAIVSLTRRLKHEPVAYIVGHKEFYGRDFLVTKETLVPRPETELLVERILTQVSTGNERLTQDSTPAKIDIIDIGTGSGNIIITLAKEIEKIHPLSDTRCYAVDMSHGALAVAKKNAAHHHVAKKILFFESDLLQKISHVLKKDHHLIIAANLPYLSEAIYKESAHDVQSYEPQSALVSGYDGLDHYRRLLIELTFLKRKDRTTALFLEISPEQTPEISALIRNTFPQATLLIQQDLSGKDRLVEAFL